MKFKRALAISVLRPNSRSSDVYYLRSFVPLSSRSLVRSSAHRRRDEKNSAEVSRQGDGKLRSFYNDRYENSRSRDSPGFIIKLMERGERRGDQQQDILSYIPLSFSLFLFFSLLFSHFILLSFYLLFFGTARDFCLSNSMLRFPRGVLTLCVYEHTKCSR